jgi:transposase
LLIQRRKPCLVSQQADLVRRRPALPEQPVRQLSACQAHPFTAPPGNLWFRLRDLLRYNLQTVRAYLLKEDFQQFWEYEQPTWAGKFLDEWCRQVMRSRLEPMKKVASTLRRHRELILNYFRARKAFSSGIVEGLNNKAKVTMRKSYGFRTYHALETALYHALGKLPEPNVVHRFF